MDLSVSHFSKSLNSLLDLTSQDRVLIALSGGIDSVVLVDLCLKVLGKDRVRVANFNHKLRPIEEQILEQNLLENLSSFWGISFFWGEAEESLVEISQKRRESLEAVARYERYKYLRKIQGREDLKYLATAHHKDDQIETFFMSLLSKGSFSSLKGIRSEREGGLIRPLLNFTRADIEHYQKDNLLPYWQDSTNVLDVYTRNKVRIQVLPRVYKLFPHSFSSLFSWHKRFSELYDWVESSLPSWDVVSSSSVKLEMKDFLKLPFFLQGEVLLKGFYLLKRDPLFSSYKVKSSFLEEIIVRIEAFNPLKKRRDVLSSGHWKISFDNFFIILEPIIVKKQEISYLLRVNSNQWYSLPWGCVKLSFYLQEPLYLASYDYRWKFSNKLPLKAKKFFSSYSHLNQDNLLLIIKEGGIVALWSKEIMSFLWRENQLSSIEIVVDKGAI